MDEHTEDGTAVVASWPDYQQSKVGIKLPGHEDRFIGAETARELADDIESNCLDDLMDPSIETREFVNDLRRHADDVEDE